MTGQAKAEMAMRAVTSLMPSMNSICGSTITHARTPTTLMVAVESHHDADALAERIGVRYTYSVAYQLASVLPPLSEYTKLWSKGELPRGFDAERFDIERLRWVDR